MVAADWPSSQVLLDGSSRIAVSEAAPHVEMSQKTSRGRPRRHRCKHFFALFAAVMCANGATLAKAQLEITWSAPQECPTQNAVIDKALQLSINMRGIANIRVERVGSSFRAAMYVATPDGTGTRVLEDTHCDQLAEDVLLVLALSVQQTDVSAPLRWTVALLTTGAQGVTPSLAMGATAALGMEWSWLRLELHGIYHLPQLARFDDGMLAARFHMLAGGVRTGVVVVLGPFELVPSLGAAFFHYVARGDGGSVSRAVRMLGWGPAAEVLLRLRFHSRWALVSAAESVVAVLRPRFVFSDAGTLYQAPPFTLRGSLGLELRF